jgi:hypothetical protein
MTAKQELYATADVFLSPSDNVQETFGITILEAMAAGLPVIASDWDGYRDTIVHGRTGFLVPTLWASGVDYVSRLGIVRNDTATHWMLGQCVNVDLKTMRQNMEALMDSGGLRHSMGCEARHRVAAEYDWPVIVRKYEALWDELIDQAAAHSGDRTPFEYGVTTFDYMRAFGHYATCIVPLEQRVGLTEIGREYAEGRQTLLPLDGNSGLFRGAVSRHIANLAAATESFEWGELSNRVARDLDLSVELARHQVARLMKYGLLELV